MSTIEDLELESNNDIVCWKVENIYKIDISNIDAITETAHISFKIIRFQHHWSIMEIQLFIKYMTAMTPQTNEKFSEKAEMLIPEIIYEGDRCCLCTYYVR